MQTEQTLNLERLEGVQPMDNSLISNLPTVAIAKLPLDWETLKLYSPQGCVLWLEVGPNGKPLKKPVKLVMRPGFHRRDLDVVNYVAVGLMAADSQLAEWVVGSPAMVKLAAYLRRYKTSSPNTIVTYTRHIKLFCGWCNKEPDYLVSSCLTPEGLVDQRGVKGLHHLLEEYVGELQARGLAPSTIRGAINAVRSLLKTNDIEVPKVLVPRNRVVYADRAPRPEELQRMLAAADLRGKVVVSMLALGGFRIGTLAKLKFRHVREDLERGITPIHVHVEAEITKGKYGDYDTFLGGEAVDYLRLYLEARRTGSPCGKIPPENLTDESPLIRSATSREPKPVITKALQKLVRSILVKAGLISGFSAKPHTLRPHSLRKFFMTQLTALGVPTDYVEYMMGHRINTYHDIKMKGVEFLRKMYAQADLRIRPKEKADIYDFVEDILKERGYLVDKDLLRRAIVKPHRTVMWGEDEKKKMIRAAFLEMLRKELLE